MMLLFFFGTGCALIRPPQPPPEPVNLRQVIDWLSGRMRKADSLQSYASITTTENGQRQSARVAIMLRRPHYLRLEILNPLRQPVQYIVCNPQRIVLYRPGDNRALQGPPTALNIYRLLGVETDMERLLAVLLALPPIPDYYPQFKLFEAQGSPEIVLDACFPDKGCPYRLWIDPYLRYPIKFSQTGGVVGQNWLVEWSDFNLQQDYYIPGRITLLNNDQQFGLEVNYSDPQLNPELSDGIFDLELPPGVEITRLDEPAPPL